MPDLPAGVTQIRLPLSNIGLSHINAYLLKGDDGYILVDCGWDTPDVLEALQAGLKDAGIALDDIRTLVVTHMHIDHYGLAGTLLRLGKMRLLMSRIDWLYLNAQYTDYALFQQESASWMARNGFAPPVRMEEERAYDAMRRFTLVAPHQELEDDDRVGQTINGSGYQVVLTPGHTQGHICLYDQDRKFLLSGDHVLEPITPNVSIWTDGLGNPLGDFLDSLRKVASLDADLVLPAHGEPFLGLRRRVDELLAHHDRRESDVFEALHEHALTSTGVAERIPWTRRRTAFDDLPVPQQRMAVSETISHLEHLYATGRVQRTERNNQIFYQHLAAD